MIKRGALIGCGFFAENHLHAWSQIEGAEIIALCDLDADRLSAAGDTFGIAARYSDAGELLKREKLDFVDIATTVASHRRLTEICAPHVDTIICQKPFAETIADARHMVDVCNQEATKLVVHENFRWQTAFTLMKQKIDAGVIGTPHFARFSFRHGFDNYVNQPYLAEIERFTIMDVGLHLFDLARHFLGDVDRLACTTQRLNPIVKGEDAFTALLHHASGATSVCDCSFYARYTPDPFPHTAAVIEGDLGTLELSRDQSLTIHDANGATVVNTEPPVPSWGEKPWHTVQNSVIAFQNHVVRVMNGHDEPTPSGAHNLETLRLALAAYDAAGQGATIDMRSWQEGLA